MTNKETTASSRCYVVTEGRNHYLVDPKLDQFIPFTSKRRAQERADEKNARRAAKPSLSIVR